MTCAAERWCGVKGKFTIKPSNLSHLNPEIESSGSWHNWQGKKQYIYIYIFTHTYIYTVYHNFISTTKQFCAVFSCFPCTETDDHFVLWPIPPSVSIKSTGTKSCCTSFAFGSLEGSASNPKLGWVLDELFAQFEKDDLQKTPSNKEWNFRETYFHIPCTKRSSWENDSHLTGW